MMNNEAIVSSIKQLCKNNNITVTQLEKEVGMSQGLVSKWKDKVPSLDKIIDIADYFHVTIDEVVGRNQLSDDVFINKLIEFTKEQTIIWHSYDSDYESNAKRLLSIITVCPDSYSKRIYFTEFQGGYITIFTFFKPNKITNPAELRLYIQTDNESECELLDCDDDDLLPLWIEILKLSKQDKPRDLKLADYKQQIIKSQVDNSSTMSNVQKLLDKYGDKKLDQLISTFSQPEMARAINAASELIRHLDNNSQVKAKTFNEILDEQYNNKRAGD